MNRLIGSLHFKIASGVIAIIVLISAFYFVADYYSNRQRLMAELHKSADQLASVSLQSLLELAMIGQHPELLQSAIERLGSNSAVDRILLMDLSGLVHFSSEPGDLGRQLGLEEEGCRSCHVGVLPQGRRSDLMELGGRRILRTVRLVPNRQDCHACHDPAMKNNGVLVIDFSTAEVEKQLRDDFHASLGRTVLTALITLVVLGVLLNKLILFPIAKLTRATAQLSRGDRSAELAAIQGKDEIGGLATSFNEMALKVQTSIHDLQNQQTYLQELMDSLPDALIVVDRDLTVEMTNRTADGIWTREKLEEIVTQQECFSEVGRALRKTLQTGELTTCQVRLEADEDTRSREGPRFVEIQCSPLRNPGDEIVKAILLIRDVTQRKAFEAQVSRADRLASIGQLAAGFAHEINNPLAAITTCVEGLGRHVAASRDISENDRQEIDEYLSIIEEAGLRCKGITRRLLTASVERGPSEMEPVDMTALVREVVALVDSQANRQGVGLEFVSAGCHDGLLVFGNREKLSQLTLNLLLNGLEAMDGDGSIEIRLARQNDFIQLQIADTGCGIPENQLERIFDPFYTTKTEGRGTGLGLALAEWIVRQHQATMEVQSRVGEGTTFSVLFPALEKRTA